MDKFVKLCCTNCVQTPGGNISYVFLQVVPGDHALHVNMQLVP